MCGCVFALGAAFFPRLGVLALWLFTPLVNRAFDTIIVPILGIIFLPFTTLVYVLVWNPLVGVSRWGLGLGDPGVYLRSSGLHRKRAW